MIMRIPDDVRLMMEELRSRFIGNPLENWGRISNQIDNSRFQKSIQCPALLDGLKESLLKSNLIDDTYIAHCPSIIKSIKGGSVQESHGDACFPGGERA